MPIDQSILEKIRTNDPAMTSLDLTTNQIGDADAAALAEALTHNTTLTYLDLRANQIGDAGATALAEALETNSTLIFLDLTGNKINTETLELVESYLLRNREMAKKQAVEVVSLHSYQVAQDDLPQGDSAIIVSDHCSPNVKKVLIIQAMALSIAAIATVTVLTCGVAGIFGASVAALYSAITFGASLSTVGAIAGGVGLFGGAALVAGSLALNRYHKEENQPRVTLRI